MKRTCTCGHAADRHNSLGVCLAKNTGRTLDVFCPCDEFTSDDTAVAKATGVLAEGGAR